MKKSVFFASALVAGFAFAGTTEVTDEYVVGALPVAMAANQHDIVLNIPWIESGTSSDGVAVTNLVKTANLAAGDLLLWYNNGSYEGWSAKSNVISGVLYWEPTTIAKDSGIAAATAATTASLSRGQALVLHRAGTAAINVYVVGQYAGNSSASSAIAAGTPAVPVYSLVAPPNVSSAVSLTNKLTCAVNGDSVTFMKNGTMVSYYYNGTNWGYDTMDGNVPKFNIASDSDMTLPVGTGFYYKRVGAQFSVNW